VRLRLGCFFFMVGKIKSISAKLGRSLIYVLRICVPLMLDFRMHHFIRSRNYVLIWLRAVFQYQVVPICAIRRSYYFFSTIKRYDCVRNRDTLCIGGVEIWWWGLNPIRHDTSEFLIGNPISWGCKSRRSWLASQYLGAAGRISDNLKFYLTCWP
jgi:hypothetical protein